MTYVRSEFENGSESDEQARSDPSEDDGYTVVIADNCRRIFVYGLKLLWTIENRNVVWSWVGELSKAFAPPKPSSRQYAQRKLPEGTQMHDKNEYLQDDASKSSSTGPGASGHQGPLSATSAVVRGLTAFAATSGSLNIPEDKILGLARFFLGIGIPGNSKDLYYQIDALSCLENNGSSYFIRSSYRLSLTSKDKLKVRVSTVLGSSAPPLSVKLMQVFSSGSKDASVLKQELHFDPKEAIYILEALPEGVDIGRILLH
ncbi:ribophorin II (RPN2) family protein [Artemisia annua]|uniref:Ribophorin II (RPN2) family protein n=1 Tax=Artemisia annua TaxID=35608 RepID=A0A2U1L6G9_ARTAN|nr:ribophorin II (RPN2) family protein [Artemisia annua]